MDQGQQATSQSSGKRSFRGWVRFLAILAAVLVVFYFLVAPVWTQYPWAVGGETDFEQLPAISPGQWVEQMIPMAGDTLNGFSFIPLFMPFDNPQGAIQVSIIQADQEVFTQGYYLNAIPTGSPLDILLPAPIQVADGETLRLRVTNHAPEEMYISLGFQPDADGEIIYAGAADHPVAGRLVASFAGEGCTSPLPIMVGLGVLWLLGLGFAIYQHARKAKGTLFWTAVSELKKYRFLIKQLVSRDFNTKYRQSVLGVVWSFLNPLLTMMVQYIVFSTIFKSEIYNYPVYLLCGIVLMNFFTESVALGMDSILTNARLITKVYIPKYIFPISKVLFSSLNMLISLIPLFIVVLITGAKLSFSLLLMPLALSLLLMFCLGMGFFMASANVFFRDTKFLWGVVSMLWLYLTPIFYPVTIIPEAYRWVFHMNPMFQFITFMRIIILDGISPGINTYIGCFLSAFIPLGLGLLVFKKSQNQFILHL